MRKHTFRYATTIGAMRRCLDFHERFEELDQFERMRLINRVLGPDWIFRLAEIEDAEKIRQRRSSWTEFYVDDVYDAHLPLDPRAPETDQYLGQEMGAKEFGFYAGQGFDGYLTALQTPREVDADEFDVYFDGYRLKHLHREEALEEYSVSDPKEIDTETYYEVYGDTLNTLFENYERIVGTFDNMDDDESIGEELQNLIDNTAAGSLMYLCGAHRGCDAHHSAEEAAVSRLESVVTFLYAHSLAAMEFRIDDADRPDPNKFNEMLNDIRRNVKKPEQQPIEKFR